MKKKKNGYKILFILTIIIVFFLVLYFGLNREITISFKTLRDIVYKPFYTISNNNTDIVGKSINEELVSENKELKKLTKKIYENILLYY